MKISKTFGDCKRCGKRKKLNGKTGLCYPGGCYQLYWRVNKKRRQKRLAQFTVDEFLLNKKTAAQRQEIKERIRKEKVLARLQKIIYIGLCRRCTNHPARGQKNGLCHSCQTIFSSYYEAMDFDEFLGSYKKGMYSFAGREEVPMRDEGSEEKRQKCLRCPNSNVMESGLCASCQKELGEVNSSRNGGDSLLSVEEFVAPELERQIPSNVIPLVVPRKEPPERDLVKPEHLGLKRNWRSLGVIFQSSAMARVLELVENVSPLDVTVLITGETGVGKNVIAKAIHVLSERTGDFVTAHCPSIARELFEAELSGHVKGAFTGALEKGRLGLFKQAARGTIFLNEITEVEIDLQAKLLEVVEQKEVRAVGSDKAEVVDVRIIAASNQNLEEMVKVGKLRRDLYHRLNVVKIHIPLLRERPEDIPVLAEYFAEHFSKKFGKTFERPLGELIPFLVKLPWSGNVRELANCIEAELLSPFSVMTGEFLLAGIEPHSAFLRASCEELDFLSQAELMSYREALEFFKKEYFSRILAKYGGKVSSAANAIKMNRGDLYEIARRVGLNIKSFRQG